MDVLKPSLPTPVDVVSAEEAHAAITGMQRRLAGLERERADAERDAAHAERRARTEPADPGMRAWEEHQLERFRAHLRAEHETEMQSLLHAAERRARACVDRARHEADLIASYARALTLREATSPSAETDVPETAPTPAPDRTSRAPVAAPDAPPVESPPPLAVTPAPTVVDAPPILPEAPAPTVEPPTAATASTPVDSRGLPVPPAPPLDVAAPATDAAANDGYASPAPPAEAIAPEAAVLRPGPRPEDPATPPAADPLVQSAPLAPPAEPVAPAEALVAPTPVTAPPPSPAPPVVSAAGPSETLSTPALDDGGQAGPPPDDGSGGHGSGGSGDPHFWPAEKSSSVRGLLGRIHGLAVLQVVAVAIILVVVLLRIG